VRTSTIWVCGDCLFAREGYGVQKPDREPWSLLPHADVELGSFHEPSCQEGGGDRCDAHNVLEADSSPCDACGSGLQGTRYAYTLFEAQTVRDARAAS
jgi:hypothetical protein